MEFIIIDSLSLLKINFANCNKTSLKLLILKFGLIGACKKSYIYSNSIFYIINKFIINHFICFFRIVSPKDSNCSVILSLTSTLNIPINQFKKSFLKSKSKLSISTLI